MMLFIKKYKIKLAIAMWKDEQQRISIEMNIRGILSYVVCPAVRNANNNSGQKKNWKLVIPFNLKLTFLCAKHGQD